MYLADPPRLVGARQIVAFEPAEHGPFDGLVRPSGSPWTERINPYENSTVDDLERVFPEEVLDPAATPFSEEVSLFENSIFGMPGW